MSEYVIMRLNYFTTAYRVWLIMILLGFQTHSLYLLDYSLALFETHASHHLLVNGP